MKHIIDYADHTQRDPISLCGLRDVEWAFCFWGDMIADSICRTCLWGRDA